MIGYLQAILYVFVISLSTVWVSHLGDNISISLLLFGVSLVAMLFFNIVRGKNIVSNHSTIKKSPFLWLSMTVAMLMAWWLSYYTAIHSSASFALTIFFLWQAIVAAVVKNKRITLFLSLTIWAAIYYMTPEASPLTLLSASLSGVMAYLYCRYSHEYATQHSMTAMDLLSIRFYPMIAFAIGYIFIDKHNAIELFTGYSMLYLSGALLFLGVLNMVIPNFLSQSSIQNIGAEKFSFIATLVPTMSYLLQGWFLNTWSFPLFILCCLSSVVLNMDFIYNYISFIRGTSVKSNV